jgi:hypothetical protein
VAVYSLRKHASIAVSVTPLVSERLQLAGILNRPTDRRGGLYDLHSGAPMATEFAINRFAVPLLAHTGWALFVDCDVVFTADVAELYALRDPSRAVQVVKHRHDPVELTKMDGVAQTRYKRKNWSSVVLWNVDHPANRRLTRSLLNDWPGRALHAFEWLSDDEIGELPRRWNWLSGVHPFPGEDGVAHLTLGGPWLKDWVGNADSLHGDGLWRAVRDEMIQHKGAESEQRS